MSVDTKAEDMAKNAKADEKPHKQSGEPPRIALYARSIKSDEVAFVVSNHDSSEVRLKSLLEVERYTTGGWKAFAAGDLRLRYSCDAEARECIALLPGAELHPPPWRVTKGFSQCRSSSAARPSGGRYRLIAKGCTQRFVVFGEPFELETAD
ncbi:MAG: hypothetical protein JXA30_16935 [Deltaproteobacteria bacterium]|nr:hypothetical protein [Deltaproteobacteria bacterium]